MMMMMLASLIAIILRCVRDGVRKYHTFRRQLVGIRNAQFLIDRYAVSIRVLLESHSVYFHFEFVIGSHRFYREKFMGYSHFTILANTEKG